MTPLFICKIQAGFPSPADDYIESPLSIDDYLVDNSAATFFVKVMGRSMENVGIYENDIAVVNRTKTPKSGDIVVAIKNGEFLIKELLIKNRQLELRAHANNFPIQILNEDQGDHIWGVVTGIVRKI